MDCSVVQVFPGKNLVVVYCKRYSCRWNNKGSCVLPTIKISKDLKCWSVKE